LVSDPVLSQYPISRVEIRFVAAITNNLDLGERAAIGSRRLDELRLHDVDVRAAVCVSKLH
jgi:hypothetical protein